MDILLITNRTDITTDFVVKSLRKRNAKFYRLNTDDIGNGICITFDIKKNLFTINDEIQHQHINLLTVKSVYFRRPELTFEQKALSQGEINFVKSELTFMLEGLYRILSNAFWVNTVWAIRGAENKIYQQLLAKDIGFIIPNSILSNVPDDAFKFYTLQNSSCIIKPIKSGLVEGSDEQSIIFTSRVYLNESNAERISSCPVYLQKLINKKGDIRVTVVGKKVFAAFIHSQDNLESKVDWRKSPKPLKHTSVNLPKDIKQKCIQITKKLSLNFAAIDLILDDQNEYIFLEINPNGQWAWIERQLNLNISDAITDLLVKNQIN